MPLASTSNTRVVLLTWKQQQKGRRILKICRHFIGVWVGSIYILHNSINMAVGGGGRVYMGKDPVVEELQQGMQNILMRRRLKCSCAPPYTIPLFFCSNFLAYIFLYYYILWEKYSAAIHTRQPTSIVVGGCRTQCLVILRGHEIVT